MGDVGDKVYVGDVIDVRGVGDVGDKGYVGDMIDVRDMGKHEGCERHKRR